MRLVETFTCPNTRVWVNAAAIWPTPVWKSPETGASCGRHCRALTRALPAGGVLLTHSPAALLDTCVRICLLSHFHALCSVRIPVLHSPRTQMGNRTCLVGVCHPGIHWYHKRYPTAD